MLSLWMQPDLSYVYLPSFDKGPVPARAPDSALHTAPKTMVWCAGCAAPFTNCVLVSSCSGAAVTAWALLWHPCVLHRDKPSATAQGSPSRRAGRAVSLSPQGKGHQHTLLHWGTCQQLPLNILMKCKSQNPLPHWAAQDVHLNTNYLISSCL